MVPPPLDGAKPTTHPAASGVCLQYLVTGGFFSVLSELLDEPAGVVAVCSYTWEAALAGRTCTSTKVEMLKRGIGLTLSQPPSCAVFPPRQAAVRCVYLSSDCCGLKLSCTLVSSVKMSLLVVP